MFDPGVACGGSTGVRNGDDVHGVVIAREDGRVKGVFLAVLDERDGEGSRIDACLMLDHVEERLPDFPWLVIVCDDDVKYHCFPSFFIESSC